MKQSLKWDDATARAELLRPAPDFVRPQADFDLNASVDFLCNAVSTLVQRVRDPTVLSRVSEHRDDIVMLRERLEHLAAAKALHDALHVVQTESAEWLDYSDADPPPLEQLRSILDAFNMHVQGLMERLPEPKTTLARRIVASMQDITANLVRAIGPQDAELILAFDTLRAVLEKDAPQVSEAIVSFCRDMPLRKFSEALDPTSGLDWCLWRQ